MALYIDMLKTTLKIGLITLTLCLLVLIGFEYFLRQSVSHITSKELEDAGGSLKFNPEFLVEYRGSKRRLRPNAAVTIQNHYLSGIDVQLRTNSLGFRGEELTSEKQENEYRILFLGDSITIGDYLPEEEVFPWMTQKLLQEKLPETKITIAVGAITNLGIEDQLEILKESGLAAEPDLVVLNFYLNDSRPPWGFSGETGKRNWLRTHSLLAETIYTRLLESNWENEQKEIRFGWLKKQDELDWKTKPEDFLALAKSAKYDWGSAWEDDSWQVIEEGLTELKKLSEKHGFKVLVNILPVSFQVYADYLENSPQQKLIKLSSKQGFKTIDMLPALRKHKDQELFYDQCHPVKLGNQLIANEIVENLSELP